MRNEAPLSSRSPRNRRPRRCVINREEVPIDTRDHASISRSGATGREHLATYAAAAFTAMAAILAASQLGEHFLYGIPYLALAFCLLVSYELRRGPQFAGLWVASLLITVLGFAVIHRSNRPHYQGFHHNGTFPPTTVFDALERSRGDA